MSKEQGDDFKNVLIFCLSTSLWAGPYAATKDAEFPPPWARPALIQVALVVDTGFNASGLIRQTHADLYDVINELLLSRKHGEQPIVQVAVIAAADKTTVDTELNQARLALLETYRHQGDPWQNQWETHKTRDREALLLSKETALQRVIAQALKESDPGQLQALHLEGMDRIELRRQVDQRSLFSMDTVQTVSDYEEQTQTRHQLYARITELARQRRAALTSQIFSSKTPSLAFAMIRILHEQLPQRGFEMP